MNLDKTQICMTSPKVFYLLNWACQHVISLLTILHNNVAKWVYFHEVLTCCWSAVHQAVRCILPIQTHHVFSLTTELCLKQTDSHSYMAEQQGTTADIVH